MNNLSYLTPEGHTVFTSEYLKKRGTCCKSACIHCPYGFTIKKHGLVFRNFLDADKSFIESLMGDFPWQSYSPENILIMSLKDQVCGAVLKNHIVIKKLALLPQYQNQGISLELAESYLFI